MKKKLLAAIAVSMLALSSVTVMAAGSPDSDSYYEITIGDESSGTEDSVSVDVEGGTITSSSGIVKVGDEITLTADVDDGYTFSKWVIDGDYTIVSGSLTDTTITIIPNSDISVNAEFIDDEGNVIDNPVDPGDNSPVSPKTGVAAGALFVTLLASGGVAVVSKKKISE